MGGLGSGNRYRFDKKRTTDECDGVDIPTFAATACSRPAGDSLCPGRGLAERQGPSALWSTGTR